MTDIIMAAIGAAIAFVAFRFHLHMVGKAYEDGYDDGWDALREELNAPPTEDEKVQIKAMTSQMVKDLLGKSFFLSANADHEFTPDPPKSH